MKKINNIAFIIQARAGSTRLPNKIIKSFYNKSCILELLFKKLSQNFNIPTILATTTNPLDDPLEKLAKQSNVLVNRGSENNVLQRFIKSAEKFNVDTIVRICSDNPFLSIKYLNEIISNWDDSFDYLSYVMNDGTPSILTHYGFWAEAVSLKALQNANAILPESDSNREHVTSYIYSKPETFKVHFLNIPEYIQKHNKTRLTLDTKNDFELQKEIYADLIHKNPNFDAEEIIKYLERNPLIFEKMTKEIIKNSK